MADFVELLASSYYSFLEGASHPESFVDRAVELGMPAIGLVDRNGLYGAPLFVRACEERGVQPLVGARLSMEDGRELAVLCKSSAGYRRLCHVITAAYRGRPKGEPLCSYNALEELRGEAFALVIDETDAEQLKYLQQVFGDDHCYLVLSLRLHEGDRTAAQERYALAQACDMRVVASNLPLYAERHEQPLQDVLSCIRERTVLRESHALLQGNAERGLKCAAELEALYAEFPDALDNAARIAVQCSVSLDFSAYRLPEYRPPEGQTHASFLRQLCCDALPHKYPHRDVQAILNDELSLIERLGMSSYFLVVWDIVEFARRKKIPVQGRGSAANSLVAYLLGITPVDPVEHKLYLGRFLHDEMRSSPDIDLDFAATRDPALPDREDVIQYVYETYGRDHVAMVCTFITFQGRSALREVGRVMELPQHIIDRMAKLVGYGSVRHATEVIETTPELIEAVDPLLWERFKQLLEEIAHVPRHLSIHVGGMLIAARPIADLVPLEPARMEGRIVCQWDKDMVEDAGLIKVDILGLGMLAVLREAQTLAAVQLPERDFSDPAIYADIARADTIGVFQIESRAQMQSLPRTRPSSFHELGVQVAIIRPGPLQGNMVSPYIRRKQGKEPVLYMHESMEPILQDTLGVILFQEQILQVAAAVAQFSPAEADGLRRAMSRKRSREAMAELAERFLEGASETGLKPEDAERVFQTLQGFASYGFCKSHALSFAKIVYQSAWLKHYYPAAFAAALLNNQPMGFYAPETILEDAKRHGVEVLPIDVNASAMRCSVDGDAIRLGLQQVHSVHHETAQRLIHEREAHGAYRSLRELVERTDLKRKQYEALIQGGALDGFGLSRRELLWQLWVVESAGREPTLFAGQTLPAPQLPAMEEWDWLRQEYDALGYSLRAHPLELLRADLDDCVRSTDLPAQPNDSVVRVAGMVICRQRPPTAKGFCFLTLEDEVGLMNIVIPPDLYEKQRGLLREAPFLRVSGRCEVVDGVVNVKARVLQALSR